MNVAAELQSDGEDLKKVMLQVGDSDRMALDLGIVLGLSHIS